MFGKRCQLCGGKLVNNRCTLCGLDQTKTDSNYKLNESDCDHRPLTHIHTEETRWENPENSRKTVKNPESSRKTVKKPIPNTIWTKQAKEKPKSKWWATVLVFIILIAGLLHEIDWDSWSSSVSEEDQISHFAEDELEEERYGNVTRELSDTGEVYEEILDPGTYIVGVHIPEGTYVAEAAEGNIGLNMNLDDGENFIYFWEELGVDGEKVKNEDLRCYTGAQLKVTEGGKLKIYSENAQTADLLWQENPLTEEVDVRDGDVAGKDFPAGTYDIVMENGETDFSYIVPGTIPEGSEEYMTVTGQFWIDTYFGTYINRNLYFPEGTKIKVDQGTVHLVPSAIIAQSYDGYYYIFE